MSDDGGVELDLERLEAEGLYSPEAPDADFAAEVLTRVIELGGTLDEIRDAVRETRVPSLMIQLMFVRGERLTQAELARRAGIPLEEVRRRWRAFGFPDPDPDELRFSTGDLQMFQTMKVADDTFGPNTSIHAARPIGTALSRIAETEIALFRSALEALIRQAEGRSIDVVHAYEALLDEQLADAEQTFARLHRHHVVELARRYERWQVPADRHNTVDLVVGFADMAGSTELTEGLDFDELDRAISRFEELTSDLVATSGATLVKRLGDAVMFVTPDPRAACSLAIDLVAAFADDPDVPRIKVGMAVGPTMALRGDYYGPPVNLAARVVDVAAPSTVVVTTALCDAIADVPGADLRPLGPRELPGLDRPVELWQLSALEPERRDLEPS